MKITIQNNIPDFSLPLPIFSSIHIADAITSNGEEFSLFVGLEEEYVKQLRQYSLNESDLELQSNTGDRKRFGEGSYEEWYKKNRTPFCLIHKQTDKLAALVWFGPEPVHDGCKCHTEAWRSYPPFRGKGIIKNFVKFAMSFYLEKFPNTRLWVAVKSENTRSRDLALHLGFVIDEGQSNDASLIMVK